MTGILNIQIKAVQGKKEINLKKIEHFIKKYSDKKPDLVIMPEFFTTGINHEDFLNHPENEFGGETIEFIKTLAKKYNTNIIAGTVIEKENDKLYNTSFAINREGGILAKYRKIHLFNYMGGTEGDRITPGDKEVVVDFDFGKVGMCICFDIRYPLQFKNLAKSGVELIVLPAAWAIPDEIYNDPATLKYAQEMWTAMLRTRAYDNMVYIAASNLTKKSNEQFSSIGTSLVVSPTAQILANAKDSECAIFADIDLSAVKYLKQIFPIAHID